MSKIEKLDKIVKKIGDWMDAVIYVLGCSGLLFAVVLCGANILSWWFFGRRLGLTDELALIGLVWASYVGMGLLYRDNGHCVMDFVPAERPDCGQDHYRYLHYRCSGSCGTLFLEACRKVSDKKAGPFKDPLFLL